MTPRDLTIIILAIALGIILAIVLYYLTTMCNSEKDEKLEVI